MVGQIKKLHNSKSTWRNAIIFFVKYLAILRDLMDVTISLPWSLIRLFAEAMHSDWFLLCILMIFLHVSTFLDIIKLKNTILFKSMKYNLLIYTGSSKTVDKFYGYSLLIASAHRLNDTAAKQLHITNFGELQSTLKRQKLCFINYFRN